MKNKKIIPIRECSCCWEYVDIEMEIFNCPNEKCSYILCKKCIINLGKQTNSDLCPACRTKLPVHYKPIEIITERTHRPVVMMMNRDEYVIGRRSGPSDEFLDSSLKFCNDFLGEMIYCITHPKLCTKICLEAIVMFSIWSMIVFCSLLLGNAISWELFPIIYCCIHNALSFIIGGILGFITLMMCILLLVLCGKGCCCKEPGRNNVIID
jgi:hypothetical protein